MAGNRPGTVTFIAVLVWIQALFQVIGGIFLLFNTGGLPVLVTSAIISIVLGVITFVVAFGLLRGSNVARIIVTIVLVLNLVNAVFSLFNGVWWHGIISGLIAIIGLIWLYTARANTFFRS